MKKTLLSLTVFTFTFSLLTSSQTISTYAGNGVGGSSGDGGPATAAELTRPYDASTDIAGNVYIADFSNARVRVVNTSGTMNTFAGTGVTGFSGDGGQATAAQLSDPAALYSDPSTGNFYIADALNNRIRLVNSSGIISTIAGNGTAGFGGDGGQATAAQLSEPFQAVTDASGNIYIADYGNNRIRMINTSGVMSTIAGNGTAAYSGDGGPATAAEIYSPPGVWIEPSGNVLIADYMNNRVRMINTNGIISTIAGTGVAASNGDGGQATAAAINQPVRVILDAQGNMYIAEYSGGKVRQVNTSGIITTVAGTGTQGYSGDGGPATAADLNFPVGLGIDASNNLFISDASNYRIREVTGIPLSVAQSPAVNNQYMVYPNPASNKVTVQFNGTKGKTIVTMYNAFGQEVFSAVSQNNNNLNINVADFAAGIYLVKLQAEDGSITTKKIEIAR